MSGYCALATFERQNNDDDRRLCVIMRHEGQSRSLFSRKPGDCRKRAYVVLGQMCARRSCTTTCEIAGDFTLIDLDDGTLRKPKPTAVVSAEARAFSGFMDETFLKCSVTLMMALNAFRR